MNHDSYPPDYTRDILREVKAFALVGASANPARPSHGVMKFLLNKGYTVVPVNPGLAGQELLGQKVYASLKDIPQPIDIVDVFRNSEAALAVTEEALKLSPLPQVIWMQLDVRNNEAARLAEAKGVKVVMDRCPAIEFARFGADFSIGKS
jgi:uncharacterized protein